MHRQTGIAQRPPHACDCKFRPIRAANPQDVNGKALSCCIPCSSATCRIRRNTVGVVARASAPSVRGDWRQLVESEATGTSSTSHSGNGNGAPQNNGTGRPAVPAASTTDWRRLIQDGENSTEQTAPAPAPVPSAAPAARAREVETPKTQPVRQPPTSPGPTPPAQPGPARQHLSREVPAVSHAQAAGLQLSGGTSGDWRALLEVFDPEEETVVVEPSGRERGAAATRVLDETTVAPPSQPAQRGVAAPAASARTEAPSRRVMPGQVPARQQAQPQRAQKQHQQASGSAGNKEPDAPPSSSGNAATARAGSWRGVQQQQQQTAPPAAARADPTPTRPSSSAPSAASSSGSASGGGAASWREKVDAELAAAAEAAAAEAAAKLAQEARQPPEAAFWGRASYDSDSETDVPARPDAESPFRFEELRASQQQPAKAPQQQQRRGEGDASREMPGGGRHGKQQQAPSGGGRADGRHAQQQQQGRQQAEGRQPVSAAAALTAPRPFEVVPLPPDAADTHLGQVAAEFFQEPQLAGLLSEVMEDPAPGARGGNQAGFGDRVDMLRSCVRELGSRTSSYIEQCVKLEQDYLKQVDAYHLHCEMTMSALENELGSAKDDLAKLEERFKKERGQLKAELKETKQEVVVLKQQVETLTGERDRAREDGKHVRKLKQLLEVKLKGALLSAENLGSNLSSGQAEMIKQLAEERTKMGTERNKATEQLTVAKEENKALTATLTAAQLCVQQLETEVAMLRDLLSGKEAYKLQQELMQTREQLGALQAESQSLRAELGSLVQERDGLLSGVSERDALLEELRHRLEGLVEHATAEKEGWDKEREQLESSLSSVTAERDELASGVRERDGAVQQLCARLEGLHSESQTLMLQLEAVSEERDKLAAAATAAGAVAAEQLAAADDDGSAASGSSTDLVAGGDLSVWLEGLQAESAQLLQQLSAAEAEHGDLLEGVAEREGQLSDLRGRLEGLAVELDAERLAWEEERQGLQAALVAGKEQHSAMAIERALLRKEVDAAQAARQQAEARARSIETEHQKVLRQLNELRERAESAGSNKAEAEHQAAQARTLLAKREAELVASKRDLALAAGQQAQAEKEAELARQLLASRDAELAASRAALEEREAKLAELQGKQAVNAAAATNALSPRGKKNPPPGNRYR